MTAIGGDIESVSLDGREFAVASENDAARQLGGFSNEVKMNGNSTFRVSQKRMPSKIDSLELSCDNDSEDQEFLQRKADAGEAMVTVITYADGNSYEGSMVITGEVEYSNAESTCTLTLEGAGLSQQ